MLLGSTYASGKRRGRWCSHNIPVTQQDLDLPGLLAPFIGGVVVDDGSDDGTVDGGSSVMSTMLPNTTCMMRGMSPEWPHEDAENESAQRRLLQRAKRFKVGFNVTNGVVGLLSKKNSESYTCYGAGEVTFTFTNATMTKSTGEMEVFLPASFDPRRQLSRKNGHRGGHGQDSSSDSSDEEDPFPTVLMTFVQTNTFNSEVVTFPVEVRCRAMYRTKDGTCTLKGLDCQDGAYSVWTTEDGDTEQTEDDLSFRGMKCIAPDAGKYWMSRWQECVATTSD